MPKKPVGKKINTTTKTVNAAISLYSIEIYPDQNTSIKPINNPPSIAPGTDPIPPNTAAVNAANQVNAQNLLNISNWALSSMWQQWRDEASWVNTSSQNAANRNHNLAMAALERSTVLDLQDKASKDSLYELIGRFGFEVYNASKNP